MLLRAFHEKPHSPRTVTARGVLCFAPFLLILALLLFLYLFLRFSTWPALETFLRLPYSREYLDRYGETIYIAAVDPESSQVTRRLRRSLDEYPRELPEIFLRAEDKRFFHHPGIDPLAVLRSSLLNLREGRIVSGASTVSMQLSGIIASSKVSERTETPLAIDGPGALQNKIGQTLNALRLELRFSKDEILEMWLGSIPFGYKSIGVAAAAFAFFDSPVEELSREEMLLLSVIPRRPVLYDPVTKPNEAISAAYRVARRLFPPVSQESLRVAVAGAKRSSWDNRAPHFVRYLSEQAGEVPGANRERITTTLDLELNIRIRQGIDKTLEQYQENRLGNGAALVLDNRRGDVLAWVGSRDFHDREHQGEIDGVLVRNQPGSTLKPFLYALAIEEGFLPNSILPDIPLDLGGEEVYQPINFDRRFRGPVRLRVALASSLNVPAVYLISRVGVQAFADYLLDLGFTSISDQRDRLGTGLALGNAEVSLLELLRAYTVFSRIDSTARLRSFLEAAPPPTKQELREPSEKRVYALSVVRDILGDNRSRIPGFGPDSVMNLPFDHLFKTGTANQFQNIWAIGAVPGYSVGVWVGNFSGETVIGETGSSIPASLVAEVLTLLHRRGEHYPPVEEAVKVPICALSGLSATDVDQAVVYEWLPPDATPSPCNWHSVDESGKIETRYPEPFHIWASEKDAILGFATPANPEIRTPGDGALFYIDSSIPLADQGFRIEAVGLGRAPYRFCFYRAGSFLFEESRPLPKYFLSFRRLPEPLEGEYTIEVSSGSNVERKASVEIVIR